MPLCGKHLLVKTKLEETRGFSFPAVCSMYVHVCTYLVPHNEKLIILAQQNNELQNTNSNALKNIPYVCKNVLLTCM